MDLNKAHNIDIYINNEQIDIYSQDELNLRFNNVFADPTKIQTTSAEYTFSFDLPKTSKNNTILDFANTPSKRAKFNKQFPATVSVDGNVMFNGTLIIQSVDKDDYNCNLYINRLNTVETIFGDSLMGEISGWTMPYNQAETINEKNNVSDISYPQDVFFPLASYGMFQKVPRSTSGTGSTDVSFYTSKHLIDKYNRFYNENFYPSINLLRTVEKCFEHKGYNVTGNIFDDEVLRRIYTSMSLADGQDPEYNYGNPNIGSLTFDWEFNSVLGSVSEDGTAQVATHIPFQVDEDMQIILKDNNGGEGNVYQYNNIYDIWSQKNDFTKVKNVSNYNLWRENMIVAPTSGYYRIRMEYSFEIDSSFTPYPCYTYVNNGSTRGSEVVQSAFTPTATFDNHWTELQLVRNNSDDNCGMITPYAVGGDRTFQRTTPPSTMIGNSINVYPHEATSLKDSQYYCYCPKTTFSMLAFDPRVDEKFIMGQCASPPYYFQSVIKNGRSWDATCTKENRARYICDGYKGWTNVWTPSPYPGRGSGYYTFKDVDTNYNKNTLSNSGTHINASNKKVTGSIETIVYLEKNDYLQMKLIQRQFTNKSAEDAITAEENGRTSGRKDTVSEFMTDVPINASGSIFFEAYSPDDISINDDSKFDMIGKVRYGEDLDLAKFLNKDEKMSDFINNFIKEFNLSYSQNGKTITLDTQKINMNADNYAVPLTERISDSDYTLEEIEYPSKMYVAYSINEDERGFYTSAEKKATQLGDISLVEANNWKDLADKGYDKIQLLDDEYGSEATASTRTSYNWFEDFTMDYEEQTGTISIPIQAKDEWMIDGYKDAEMMKKDGYGLKQRYWFPSDITDKFIYLANQHTDSKKVFIKLCKSIYDDCDMSYKDPENTIAKNTLLTRYFNIFFNCDTNYLKCDVYLTTEEYLAIKNGANVLIDDDVYIVTKIDGYDCSGKNKTKLTCIKK